MDGRWIVLVVALLGSAGGSPRPRLGVGRVVGLVAVGVLLAGCLGRSPVVDAPFTLAVVPQQLQGLSIAGQKVVFLVTLSTGSGGPVTISATATGADAGVEGGELASGDQVAEVTVVPLAESVGGSVTVTIEGRRGTATDVVPATFEVIEGEDDRASVAAGLRDRFVAWLAENRPELRITAATSWEGSMVSPQWLVVSHYLFFSPEWEAHVSWHIMIAPDDWALLDLRRRFSGTTPSEAFEIPSVSGRDQPRPSEVPESVWR